MRRGRIPFVAQIRITCAAKGIALEDVALATLIDDDVAVIETVTILDDLSAPMSWWMHS